MVLVVVMLTFLLLRVGVSGGAGSLLLHVVLSVELHCRPVLLCCFCVVDVGLCVTPVWADHQFLPCLLFRAYVLK